MSKQSAPGADWRRIARRVAAKINLAWWLDKLAAPLMLSTLVIACSVLWGRRALPSFPWTAAWIGGAVLLLGVALAALLWARRHFENADDAMVRMEASMKLRNALSAAREGVAPWPQVPERIDDGTRWRWSRLGVPILASLIFLAASIFLPVSARTDPAPPVDEPQVWRDLEADIDLLEENDTVQEEYLDELKERLEELRNQDEEEWFSHSSLEATDALRKIHGAELENVEQNLRKAERALDGLQNHSGQLGEAGRQRLLNEFEEAMQQLGQGAMKPNKALLEQLRQLDPGNLGQLNQQQLDQLRENMRKQAGNCQQCQGQGEGGQGPGSGNGSGEDWLDDLLNQEEGRSGNGEGSGNQNRPGQGPGQGGVNRGPGTAPGVLGELGQDVGAGDLEGLESEDPTRSRPGDLLDLIDGEHEVDEGKVGVREGGSVSETGEGGDRVWKDALLPDEKRALKNFFK